MPPKTLMDMIIPQQVSPVSTGVNIKDPKEQGGALDRMDAFIALNDLLNNFGISDENQPMAHNEIINMWEESGKPYVSPSSLKPHIGTSSILNFISPNIENRPVYKSRSILSEFTSPDSPDTVLTSGGGIHSLLAEFAHGYQLGDKPLPTRAVKGLKSGVEGIYDLFASLFGAPRESRYNRPGTFEYEAHQIIEPELDKRTKDALIKDFTNLLGKDRTEGMSGGPEGIEHWGYDRIAKYMNNIIKQRKEEKEWQGLINKTKDIRKLK